MRDPSDPRRTHRLVVGLAASLLLVAAAFFESAVYGFADGGHTPLLRDSIGARSILIAVVGLAAAWFVLAPPRLDARICQSAMLGAAVVGIAVGFVTFTGALQTPTSSFVTESWPGVQAWALLVAGVLFIYLRWRRDLWPESRWEQEIMAAKGTR